MLISMQEGRGATAGDQGGDTGCSWIWEGRGAGGVHNPERGLLAPPPETGLLWGWVGGLRMCISDNFSAI